MSFFSSIGKALKSRTVLVGIGTTLLGGAELLGHAAPYIAPYVPAGTPIGASIIVGLGVATVIGRLRAKQPIGPVIDDTIAKTVKAVHMIGVNRDEPTPTTIIPVPQTTVGQVAQLKEIASIVKTIPTR